MTGSPSFDLLDADAAEGIAALCARSLADAPSADEIRGALFAPDQPAVVRGDPDRGVVASTTGPGGGYVRLVVVDPDHRGRRLGHALLAAAEADLTDQPSVTVGADAPYYLWPGVESTQTALLCLLERRKYARVEANFNMAVDLAGIPDDPGGTELATSADRDEVEGFTTANYPNWRDEALRALGKGTLLVSRDDRGVAAICAWDVNRRGLLGPVAVRLDLIGRGAGVAVLVGALHRIRAEGRKSVEVTWVGPIVPYARVGGTVGRVFFVYRKQLRP